MKQNFKTGLMLVGTLSILTGILYPLAVTGLAQLC